MLVYSFLFLSVCVVGAQVRQAIDHCNLMEVGTCGQGKCLELATGNRCRCGPGRMGNKCERPCQDVYKSCRRWKQEGRCVWSQVIVPFFEDNCAMSCGILLAKALPVGLEPLAWLVGRWETKVSNNLRFPTNMQGPQGYHEVLEIQLNEVNMFDRPTLNYSVKARAQNGQEEHNELGFITMKQGHEDTGFVQDHQQWLNTDQVAIEMTSNTGISTIEEGVLGQKELVLKVTHKAVLDHPDQRFVTAQRRFIQRTPMTLDEIVTLTDDTRRPRTFVKRYRRTFDYLHDFRRKVDNDLGLIDDVKA